MPRQKITTSLIENTECILLSCHKVINFDFWSDLATSPPFWVDLPSREKRSDLTSAPKLPCMSEDWSSGRGRRVHATWPHGDHQGKGTQTERGREGKREREREAHSNTLAARHEMECFTMCGPNVRPIWCLPFRPASKVTLARSLLCLNPRSI